MSDRKSSAEREREGAQLALLGVFLVVFGFLLSLPLAVVGLVLSVAGTVMWGAAMARPEDRQNH